MTTTFHLGFRTKLDPNAEQVRYFINACGVARFAYNWALEQWQRLYEECRNDLSKPKPTEAGLRRMLNSIKREKFPWMLNVTKCAVQYAIKDLGKAFHNFFVNPEHFGYPKFKKKFCDDSFTMSSDHFKIEGSRIRIPLLGWVRMHESLRFKNAKVLFATITRVGDDWFVGIQVELTELTHLTPAQNHGCVGVDLGISHMAVLSDGTVFEAPNPLKKELEKLKRLQRKHSRTKKGSNNSQKLKKKIQKLHARIANVRRDALHKATHYISSNYSTVVIEDLNVGGMLKNHKLARSIADVGFWEFRRQLTYKVGLRGGEVIFADRWYPSSRLCRFCGQKNEELTLSDRKWTCPHCGRLIEDRDLNAALNLRDYEKYRGDWRAHVRPAPSESSPDTAPPTEASRQSELADDDVSYVVRIDEGAALPMGHPKVTAPGDWGRRTACEKK